MYQKLIHLVLIILLITSCSKKEIELDVTPADKDESFRIYKEAIESMETGDWPPAHGVLGLWRFPYVVVLSSYESYESIDLHY